MRVTPHIVVQGADRACALYQVAFGAPVAGGGTAVVLGLEVDDADAVFAQAVAGGAHVRQPPQDMFWGDRHAQLDDPFGHRWNISQHVRDVLPRRSSPAPRSC